MWCAAKSGTSSVKIGHQLLSNEVEEELWPTKLFWDKDCLPKAGSFAWLATKERILTDDRRHKFGFHGPSRCSLCEASQEDANHPLLNRTVAMEMWKMLQEKLGWQGLLPVTLRDLFFCWPCKQPRSVYSSLWKLCPT